MNWKAACSPFTRKKMDESQKIWSAEEKKNVKLIGGDGGKRKGGEGMGGEKRRRSTDCCMHCTTITYAQLVVVF